MPTPTYTKNFKSLTTLDEVKDSLDSTFNQIFDLLVTNPDIKSLLDPKEPVPSHKAGDLVSDLRDDTPKLKWSDGGTLRPFGLSSFDGAIDDNQHGERASWVEDPATPGTVLFYLHPDATTTRSGFLSATDKVKLDAAITTIPYGGATPVSVDAAAGTVGVSTNVSRADHVHQVLTGTPVSIGSANTAGTSNNLSRADHVHNHGTQTDPTHHAAAVAGGNAGFLAGADKTKIDKMQGNFSTTAAARPTFANNGDFGFWNRTDDGSFHVLWLQGGVHYAAQGLAV